MDKDKDEDKDIGGKLPQVAASGGEKREEILSLMNTENLKLDPSTALPSYPLLRMTFHKEGKGRILSRGCGGAD